MKCNLMAYLVLSLTLFIQPVIAEESGNSLGSAAGKTWEGVKTGSKEIWDGVSEGSKEAWEATKEGSSEAWDATKEGTKTLRKKVGGAISGE
jgi:hypothetical protein